MDGKALRRHRLISAFHGHEKGSRPIAIYGAIAANIGITVTKFMVALATGSSAMFSEAIHSTVDTFNGVLLLAGLKWSKRPANDAHPFGHGREVYFWSLMVAVLIFGLGGGVSFYEGIHHIQHPSPLKEPGWNYMVLAIAALFESSSFAIALREFMQRKGKMPFWTALLHSKDPTVYTVLAEDAAALVGLLFAATGIFVSHRYDLPMADGLASVLIGMLLCSVALILVHEARGLLIGEGMRPESVAFIYEMVMQEPSIHHIGLVRTVYLGPDEVIVSLRLQFNEGILANDAGRALSTLKQRIRARYPMVSHLMIEVVSPT